MWRISDVWRILDFLLYYNYNVKGLVKHYLKTCVRLQKDACLYYSLGSHTLDKQDFIGSSTCLKNLEIKIQVFLLFLHFSAQNNFTAIFFSFFFCLEESRILQHGTLI